MQKDVAVGTVIEPHNISYILLCMIQVYMTINISGYLRNITGADPGGGNRGQSPPPFSCELPIQHNWSINLNINFYSAHYLLTLGACARVTVVVLCVCLSVTTLAATYLVYGSRLLRYKVPYGVPNAWFVWISQKTICSPVLASFADLSFLTFSASGSMDFTYK